MLKKYSEDIQWLPLPVISKKDMWFDNFATMNHFHFDIYLFETKIDVKWPNIKLTGYRVKNINLYIKVWVKKRPRT